MQHRLCVKDQRLCVGSLRDCRYGMRRVQSAQLGHSFLRVLSVASTGQAANSCRKTALADCRLGPPDVGRHRRGCGARGSPRASRRRRSVRPQCKVFTRCPASQQLHTETVRAPLAPTPASTPKARVLTQNTWPKHVQATPGVPALKVGVRHGLEQLGKLNGCKTTSLARNMLEGGQSKA